jgi:hypothetical protein
MKEVEIVTYITFSIGAVSDLDELSDKMVD